MKGARGRKKRCEKGKSAMRNRPARRLSVRRKARKMTADASRRRQPAKSVAQGLAGIKVASAKPWALSVERGSGIGVGGFVFCLVGFAQSAHAGHSACWMEPRSRSPPSMPSSRAENCSADPPTARPPRPVLWEPAKFGDAACSSSAAAEADQLMHSSPSCIYASSFVSDMLATLRIACFGTYLGRLTYPPAAYPAAPRILTRSAIPRTSVAMPWRGSATALHSMYRSFGGDVSFEQSLGLRPVCPVEPIGRPMRF
jgi:hypothetical protein